MSVQGVAPWLDEVPVALALAVAVAPPPPPLPQRPHVSAHRLGPVRDGSQHLPKSGREGGLRGGRESCGDDRRMACTGGEFTTRAPGADPACAYPPNTHPSADGR